MVERVEGTYFQQGFSEGKGSPKPYGKLRKVKNIDKIERKTGFDINGDGLVAEDDFEEFDNGDVGINQDDNSPLFRMDQTLLSNTFVDPLA